MPLHQTARKAARGHRDIEARPYLVLFVENNFYWCISYFCPIDILICIEKAICIKHLK
jgi:hypothetical protein